MAAKYLTKVGQLQWLVTLGRFDIHGQVATMLTGFYQKTKSLCLVVT